MWFVNESSNCHSHQIKQFLGSVELQFHIQAAKSSYPFTNRHIILFTDAYLRSSGTSEPVYKWQIFVRIDQMLVKMYHRLQRLTVNSSLLKTSSHFILLNLIWIQYFCRLYNDQSHRKTLHDSCKIWPRMYTDELHDMNSIYRIFWCRFIEAMNIYMCAVYSSGSLCLYTHLQLHSAEPVDKSKWKK